MNLFNDNTLADQTGGNLFGAGALVGALQEFLPLNEDGLKMAVASGARYGLAVGNGESKVNLGFKTITFESQVDVVVGPRPTTEVVTTAVSRFTLQEIPRYKNLLGIQKADKL